MPFRVIPKGWTIERTLLVGTFFVSATAFIFGIGVNWAEVRAVKADVEAAKTTYVRADVYSAEQRRIAESLERLNRNMEKFEAYWYQEPGPPEPRPPRRMFDR